MMGVLKLTKNVTSIVDDPLPIICKTFSRLWRSLFYSSSLNSSTEVLLWLASFLSATRIAANFDQTAKYWERERERERKSSSSNTKFSNVIEKCKTRVIALLPLLATTCVDVQEQKKQEGSDGGITSPSLLPSWPPSKLLSPFCSLPKQLIL